MVRPMKGLSSYYYYYYYYYFYPHVSLSVSGGSSGLYSLGLICMRCGTGGDSVGECPVHLWPPGRRGEEEEGGEGEV